MAIRGKKAQVDRVLTSDFQSLVREPESSGGAVKVLKGQEVAGC
jgi:hypothetical protein